MALAALAVLVADGYLELWRIHLDRILAAPDGRLATVSPGNGPETWGRWWSMGTPNMNGFPSNRP